MYDNDIEYIRGRLVGTILRIKEEPIIIQGAKFYRNKVKISATYLVSGLAVEVNSEEINFESPPLGYVNYGKGAYYVVRKPMRNDWKQGIRPGNIAFINQEGFYDIPHREFGNTILGRYPSFALSKSLVEDSNYEKVAFSRDFSLGKDKLFWYKGIVVGVYDKMVTLDRDFEYLNEYVSEVLDDKN